MKTPVQVSSQVEQFLKAQPPDARQRLRRGIRELAGGKGDIRALRDELEGYCRLRVGEFRVIFRHINGRGGPVCSCSFVETRAIVYEVFAAILSEEGQL